MMPNNQAGKENPTPTQTFSWSQLSKRQQRLVISAACLIVLVVIVYFTLFGGLPSETEIKAYQPESTARMDDVDWSRPVTELIRIWVSQERISPWLKKAVVISEDDRFYQHNGVNFEMLREAFKVNWEKKRYVRGASTITMQLARNAFLHKRKTLLRKIREIILARRIEDCLSKERILELYLNVVEWGENIYGAEAAARFYFGKSAADLNLSEASLLAGMLPNPKYFNPFKRPASCRRMQKRVLRLMQISRAITSEQLQAGTFSVTQLRGEVQTAAQSQIDSLEEAKYRLTPLDTIPILRPTNLDTTVRSDSAALQDSLF